MPATKDYVTAHKNSRTSGDAQQDTALGDAWVCSGLKTILCHTVGSGSNAKLVTYFLPDLFRDGEGQECQTSTQSIGQGLRCPDGNDFGAEMHLLH
jgi:hypothetical protein